VKKLVVVFVVAMFILAGCGDGTDTIPSVSDTLSPGQEKAQEMADAAYYGSIVVVFNKTIADGDKYAVCNGTTRIIGLDAGETRRVELSTQEALNASLCKLDTNTGNYSPVQDIGGTSPGDYLEWSGSEFGITRYVP